MRIETVLASRENVTTQVNLTTAVICLHSVPGRGGDFYEAGASDYRDCLCGHHDHCALSEPRGRGDLADGVGVQSRAGRQWRSSDRLRIYGPKRSKQGDRRVDVFRVAELRDDGESRREVPEFRLRERGACPLHDDEVHLALPLS